MIDFRSTASEHAIQAAFIEWCHVMSKIDNRFEYIFGVPNAAKRSQYIARKMLEEGLSAGVPDVLCLFPTSHYPGFAIEFKSAGKIPTKQQARWLGRLHAAGWKVGVLYSVEEAVAFTTAYFAVGEKRLRVPTERKIPDNHGGTTG